MLFGICAPLGASISEIPSNRITLFINGIIEAAKLCARLGVSDTNDMTTSERWIKAIEEACAEPDMSYSNQLITRLHYLLSEALADRLGRAGGPNFHSWAVWGSRKAGATIRQEDLESAITNATLTAGAVGSVVGVLTAVIAGNSEIVYHEHIRLEPYIHGAMPFIVRRCVTQRMMAYEIGEQSLAVGDDLPGAPATAARNWANIEERMPYVFALFRKFHTAPEVFSMPCREMEIMGLDKSVHFSD
ncbi:hypothetical protein [Acidicapsa ligni]|uniref:hypothetical protein n=1 Tax=Acidicapsa ligni TaxID=542300 RepID=UPI0021E03397|nr:hypothetical protein [Acidicapsa ligni]